MLWKKQLYIFCPWEHLKQDIFGLHSIRQTQHDYLWKRSILSQIKKKYSKDAYPNHNDLENILVDFEKKLKDLPAKRGENFSRRQKKKTNKKS